jgi:hypothetical protein
LPDPAWIGDGLAGIDVAAGARHPPQGWPGE